MSNVPADLKYTEHDEWIRVEADGTLTIGITDHAQAELSDVVYVELPKVGDKVQAKQPVAVVESVKAASDIYAPVSGTIVEVNTALEANPALVNSDPEGEGWFFRMTLSDKSQLDGLMNAEAYKAFIADL